MDFEQMGTMLGAKAAIGQVAADANALVAQKNRDLAKVRGTLAVEEAYAAGLLAQVMALREELKRVSPKSAILAETGRVFENGERETRLALVFAQAFDAKARAVGLENPERFRERVK